LETEDDPLALVEVEDEMGEAFVSEDRHDDHLSFLPTAHVASAVPFEQDRSNLTLDTEPREAMAAAAIDGSGRTRARVVDVTGLPSGEHEIVLPISLAIGDKRIQFKLMVRLDLAQEGTTDSTLDDMGGGTTCSR
jgi:hypothetical protein